MQSFRSVKLASVICGLLLAGLTAIGIGIANADTSTYRYEWLSQSYELPATPQTPGNLTITIRNIGSQNWTNANVPEQIRLGTTRGRDRASELATDSWAGPNRVGTYAGKAILDGAGQPNRHADGTVDFTPGITTVAPGEAAVWSFPVQTPDHPTDLREYFNFVIDNVTWLNDQGIFWPVHMSQGYASKIVAQSEFPSTTEGDADAQLWFDYQNVGEFDWQKDGIVRLGTDRDRDRTSKFADSRWVSPDRPGTFAGKVVNGQLDTSATVILPGETARFIVPLKTNVQTLGKSREYFRLVAERWSWLEDYGAYQDVTVQKKVQPVPVPTTIPAPSPTVTMIPSPSPSTSPSIAPTVLPGASPPPSTTPTPTATPTVAGNPFSGVAFFVDPYSNAKATADSWRTSRPTDAAQMDKIAGSPHADWFGEWSGTIQTAVANRTNQIRGAGKLPVYVAYNIPQRDCGGFSAGGSNSPDGYRAWIDGFAAGLGQGSSVVFLEPDAVAMWDCLSATDRQTRIDLLRYAINKLSATGASVYLDAAHSNWLSVSETVNRLNTVGLGNARGFVLNISNYRGTAELTAFGTQVSTQLGGKPFVLDTSRNGINYTGYEWCNVAGQALGTRPTANTGNPLIDAYFWIKAPGESDGWCNGGPAAGQWWPEYALGLAQRAAF